MVVVPAWFQKCPPFARILFSFIMRDNFQRPNPFRLDIAVDIDSVIDIKDRRSRFPRVAVLRVAALGGWQTRRRPGRAGGAQGMAKASPHPPDHPQVRASLIKWYGSEKRHRGKIL